MKNLAKLFLFIVAIIPAAALMAEKSTSYEVKSGTVVAVYNDQLVVKMANGDAREITVPAGFKFTVGGKEVGLNELKPGTELNAVITTTKTPQKVRTVKVKNGEVLKVMGNTVWFRHEGKNKSYTVPEGFNLFVDGKKVRAQDLRPGQRLTAEIVYTSETTLTEREVAISGTPPKPPR